MNIPGRRCLSSIKICMRIIPNDTKVFILVRKTSKCSNSNAMISS